MELAYRLAVEESPLIRQIRDRIIVTIPPAADPDGRDRYVDWYRKHLVDITERAGPHRRAAVLGQVHLSRQQPGHQLLAGDDAGAPRVVPAVASAGDARPARVGAVPLHVLRTGAAEPDSRSDPVRRAADVRQLRDGAADQVRHARRVDARLRRHVVAGLPRVHVLESQRPDPDVRDVRQRRRDDDEADGRRTPVPRRAPARPAASGIDRCPPYKEVEWSMRNNTNYMQTGVLIGARATRRRSPRSCSRTSTARAATPSRPGRRSAVRLRRARRPGGPDPRGRCSSNCCAPGHRSRPSDGRAHPQGRQVPAGSYVVKRDQPYGRLAKILLEKQDLPDQLCAPTTTPAGRWG